MLRRTQTQYTCYYVVVHRLLSVIDIQLIKGFRCVMTSKDTSLASQKPIQHYPIPVQLSSHLHNIFPWDLFQNYLCSPSGMFINRTSPHTHKRPSGMFFNRTSPHTHNRISGMLFNRTSPHTHKRTSGMLFNRTYPHTHYRTYGMSFNRTSCHTH
jgi:hypothetical protein